MEHTFTHGPGSAPGPIGQVEGRWQTWWGCRPHGRAENNISTKIRSVWNRGLQTTILLMDSGIRCGWYKTLWFPGPWSTNHSSDLAEDWASATDNTPFPFTWRPEHNHVNNNNLLYCTSGKNTKMQNATMDIGRNWNVLSYTSIQSIPNMLNGWHLVSMRAGKCSASRNCVQILATWDCALS